MNEEELKEKLENAGFIVDGSGKIVGHEEPSSGTTDDQAIKEAEARGRREVYSRLALEEIKRQTGQQEPKKPKPKKKPRPKRGTAGYQWFEELTEGR